MLMTLALALAGAGTADASVYVSAGLPTLAAEARAIVYGRVAAIESRWTDAETRRQIETVVTLEALEYAKGNLGATVSFRVPGGQIGPYRTLMIGAPAFRAGEEVVVFLAGGAPALPRPLSLAQGVYRVRLSAGSGARVVIPEVPRLPGLAAAQTARITRGDVSRRPAPLAAFLQELRQLAGRAQ
jgi:hypothetical protein